MAYLRFRESLRGRIAVTGVRSVLASVGPAGAKMGLGACVPFVIIGVLGILARWRRDGVLDLWLLFAGALFGFSVGWAYGVFSNLIDRTLVFLGDRGIDLSEGKAVLGHWHPQEVASLEVVDGPEDRVIFEIEFVDSNRYPPLQFITTCSPERRLELVQGMQLFAAAQSADPDNNLAHTPQWSTEEAEHTAILRYGTLRLLYVVATIAVGLLVIMFVALWGMSGNSFFLGVAAFTALLFLPLLFLRWVGRWRFHRPYQEAVARRSSKGSN